MSSKCSIEMWDSGADNLHVYFETTNNNYYLEYEDYGQDTLHRIKITEDLAKLIKETILLSKK